VPLQVERLKLRYMSRFALAKCLKQLRKLNKMSQEELAISSGVGKRAIGEIERGEGNPTLETIERLSRVLGQPLLTVCDLHSALPEPRFMAVGEHLSPSLDKAATFFALLEMQKPDIQKTVYFLALGEPAYVSDLPKKHQNKLSEFLELCSRDADTQSHG
jgi:transcriptional regulator with XRE-family HTH domain